MLRSRSAAVSFPFVKQVRFSSGYKLNSDRKAIQENLNGEDAFRERVETAVRNRARTKLRGFEKVEYMDIVKRTEGPDPNESYRDRNDLPKYRSFRRYFVSAERERRRQRNEGVWWKTLDYWMKQRESLPDFKDIGYALPRTSKRESMSDKKELNILRKKSGLEKCARDRTLFLDPEIVTDEWQESVAGAKGIKTISHHYNIYKDLFENADFYPVLPLDIEYNCGDDLVNPVYYGNELTPSETAQEPVLHYKPVPNKQYTLLLTNPDAHLEKSDHEYVHWLVGNIPGNHISDGDVLVDYLRPFPARGTGYQRMVFILFEQSEKVSFQTEQRVLPCASLHERDFKTCEFFGKFCEYLTPVSLRFFQCAWDESVQNTFHTILQMREPVYEYSKLSEKPRLAKLWRQPANKTVQWLERFMPEEPVYPDGSPEAIEVMRQTAIEASAAHIRENSKPFPVRNIY